MRNIIKYSEFIREFVEAGKKDVMRIEVLIDRSKDDDHLLRLAANMAEAIGRNMIPGTAKADKAALKAQQRGLAAEDINYHDVAAVFFDRARRLGYVS